MSVVSYSRHSVVGAITLNRPPANGYEIDFVRALGKCIDAAEAEKECRVVVVRSALPGFFCGGADIKQFLANTPAQNMEFIALAHETLSRPAQSERVYVAEVAGHALGGGLEIALACDLRFAAKGTYKLGLPEVTLGLLPGNGGTQRLSALVGPNRALELMITGASVDPEEAHRLGIVNRLYEPAELEKATREFAERLGQSATLAVGRIKRSVYDGYCRSLDAGLAVERRNIAKLFASEDSMEGFRAFTERREPKFAGR